MTRKSATAVKEQPSLLDQAPQPAPASKPVATTTGAKKKPAGTAVSTEVRPNQSRVQEIKSTAANTLGVLAQALKDPNFKPESMRMMLDMQKEMVAEQARIDFINAFHALKKLLPRINRDGKIEVLEKGQDGKRVAGRDRIQQSTPFATYENIREKVDPHLDLHGFTMWDETEPSADGARINVIVHLDHNSGHGRKTTFPLPAETSGSKNNVQGWGSSFSYGRRYGAIGLLGLRTAAPSDQDRDGHAPEQGRSRGRADKKAADETPPADETVVLITQDQEDKLRELLEQKGKKGADFCKAWKIDKLASLEAEFYAQATDALKKLPDA